MVVITFRKIRDFVDQHNQAKIALFHWFNIVEHADWSCLSDIKKQYPAVDYVGEDRFVFNIKGNHYRLIAMIHFDKRTVYIRFIGTHSEYDRIDASSI